jgi:hypothetical protein
MKVGSPRLLVAVCSLATIPQTVDCSPIWFLESAAVIVVAIAGNRATDSIINKVLKVRNVLILSSRPCEIRLNLILHAVRKCPYLNR